MKRLSVLIVVPLFTDDVKFLILFCLSLAILPTPQLLIYLEVFSLIYGDWGLGTGTQLLPQYPIPNTQYRTICTKINDLSHKESNHGIHPRVAPTAG
ncbi:hypothetical protein [Nostoc sp.]|uniref:hypothetical protein n=1 Tax=Nostoc sp. TaxID=1180 RepID=UPI002FF6A1EB